ncbi:MAG: sodium:proton antiporter [Pseudomonadota bacterium]
MGGMAIPLWASVPFLAFLVAIAAGPFVHRAWWERSYHVIAIALGLATALAYASLFHNYDRIWHTALDYFSFIVLLASLFVVTGGILIRIGGRPHPLINAAILLVGALLSNVLGTTGASMLFIRPYLHINRARMKGYLIVFFIFAVSNIGGALTPIGDPPLFLGYLKGVPFFWVIANAWQAWAFTLFAVLAVFLVMDYKNHRATPPLSVAASGSRLLLKGWYNFFFLAVIILAVFRPTPYRELMMLGAAAASYLLTPRDIHREHHFTFGPIREVAILFFGIFATMMPALDWLEANSHSLGISTPGGYYWASGLLSSFLDNAPTYLSFLEAAKGLKGMGVAGLLSQAPHFILAISLGAVFFGAMTYIGNGPNFMVKSIAERAGLGCPSFLGYIFRYSAPILLPIFFLVWLIFL